MSAGLVRSLRCAVAAVLLTGVAAQGPARASALTRPDPIPRLARLLPRVSPAPGDDFGWSVAVSGQVAVVGAPFGNTGQGAAYVFARSGRSWHLQQKLTEAGTTLFGVTVAASGATVAVDASSDAATGAGAVYVFTRAAGRWNLQDVLTSPIAKPSYGTFGSSLAIWRSTLVVGGFVVRPVTGKVFVFVRTGSAWRLQATLGDATHSPDAFGSAVAVTHTRLGTYALVGDSCVGSSNCTGAADVFRRPPDRTGWFLQARLRAPHTLFFGESVALSGATAVIGGDLSAWVFRRWGRHWTRQAKLVPSRADKVDEFGQAVAVSGDRALAGDPQTGPKKHVCGTAYEFTRSRARWPERARLVNPGCAPNDDFGAAVALSGTTALIGAPGKDKSAGAAYLISVP